jgi:mono/diheme cytochrome c family protein
VLRRISIAVLVVVVLLGGGFFAWAWHGELPAEPRRDASAYDPAVVAKGASLAAIGSCAVCHTARNAPSFAGGYPVETPFGVVYGSNITPDRDTGIGAWSPAAFRRAMREGVDREGHHLYPAFPYDHFTGATNADLDAVYAYLMTREPVRRETPAPGLAFPFNIRLAAAGWKLLFLKRGEFVPDRSRSPEWQRGAYLAETFGHCSACHTPRNALGAEKRDEKYAGGIAEGWIGPALNASSPAPAPWTADAAFNYLRHGFDRAHGHVAGPMQEVVTHLRQANEGDVRAMATYIASLNGVAAPDAAEQARQNAMTREFPIPGKATTGSSGNSAVGVNGAAIFAGACATCHHAGGNLPLSRPVPLGLSSAVNSADPRNLLQIVLSGIHPAPNERGAIMPAFSGTLTDAQIVALADYVREHFSGKTKWNGTGATLDAIRRGKDS